MNAFINRRLNAKDRKLIKTAVAWQIDSPGLRHALQDEINRLLPHPDLYSAVAAAGVILKEVLNRQGQKPPQGDRLVEFNRALLECALWSIVAVLLARVMWRLDGSPDRLWGRGLWALGVLTPWVFFSLVLGIFVGMMGTKSFSAMPFVSLVFGTAILVLGIRWRRRLPALEKVQLINA